MPIPIVDVLVVIHVPHERLGGALDVEWKRLSVAVIVAHAAGNAFFCSVVERFVFGPLCSVALQPGSGHLDFPRSIKHADQGAKAVLIGARIDARVDEGGLVGL